MDERGATDALRWRDVVAALAILRRTSAFSLRASLDAIMVVLIVSHRIRFLDRVQRLCLAVESQHAGTRGDLCLRQPGNRRDTRTSAAGRSAGLSGVVG